MRLLLLLFVELHTVEVGVAAAFGKQLGMFALLDNPAFVHHHNLIGLLDGREAVCHHQSGTLLHEFIECGLHQAFGFGVERAGGFVQNQDGHVFQQGAGDGDTLALTAGKFETVFADFGLQTMMNTLWVAVLVGDTIWAGSESKRP